MLYDVILTLKRQKPLETILIYPPPTSVSTAIFSNYKRSNKAISCLLINFLPMNFHSTKKNKTKNCMIKAV